MEAGGSNIVQQQIEGIKNMENNNGSIGLLTSKVKPQVSEAHMYLEPK